MHSLKIKNLSVMVDEKLILDDFNLEIKKGEIHAIMGPNGTGKSTLTKVIMGSSNYEIIKGEIFFDDKKINDLTVDERSKLGIFLGMQQPMEIDGVTNADFLKAAIRSRDDHFKLFDFIRELEANVENLSMNKEIIHRSVNKDFSGGEKKKNEILQMYMLKPNFVMLDEIDSGLDVDSLKIVGNGIMKYYNEKNPSMLLITHYNKLFEYIKPEYVHIMKNGKIIKTGSYELVHQIEEKGYNSFGDDDE